MADSGAASAPAAAIAEQSLNTAFAPRAAPRTMKITTTTLMLALTALVACDANKEEASADQAQAKTETPAAAEAEAKTETETKELQLVANAAGENKPEHDEGCLHEKQEGESCDHEAPPADGAAGHFGAPFASAESQPLSAAIASFSSENQSPVLVSGEVKSVCKMKGCWMVIEDGELQARVLMKDHAFAVPMDGEGAAAKVEGVLTEKTLSEAQVKHIEKDAGRDPEAVSGERKEYILTATAVELTRS